MKKLFTKKLLLAAIMMVAGAMNLMAAKGDKFTAMTKEGVEMTFEVLNEEKKECMVAGDYDHTCIDRDVTGTVTIPETAMGYKVTWISQYAFFYCSIWSVVIPQTVTGLGPYAFANCENLIRCYLPDAMEYIYSGTFMGCKSLDEVYIPHHVKSIEHDAFQYCYNLKSIVIPASVTFIGAYAFQDCSNLRYVVFLGSECPTFDIEAFYNTPYDNSGSKVTVFVPNRGTSNYNTNLLRLFNHGAPTIKTLEYYHNYIVDRETMGYLANVYITGYDESESRYTCEYEGAKESLGPEYTTLTVPEEFLGFAVTALRSIGKMSYLETAVIPGSCKKIESNDVGRGCFEPSHQLREVEIQEGVESIGGFSFAGTAIKELRLPKSLKEYVTSAVKDCSNLTDVYLPVDEVQISIHEVIVYYDEFSFEYVQYCSNSQATLHVPFGAAQNYASLVPDEFAKIEEFDPTEPSVEMKATDVTLNNSRKGETTLSLNSTIPSDIVALQFRIYAPDGITIEGYEAIEEAFSGGYNSISLSYSAPKKRYTIIIVSLDGEGYDAPMCQGEGFIGFLKLKIKASEEIEYNKDYTVELKEIKLYEEEHTETIHGDDTSFTVTVVNENPTDIEEIVSDVNTDTTYNLSGIQTSKILRKGIYIRNGKKTVVR